MTRNRHVYSISFYCFCFFLAGSSFVCFLRFFSALSVSFEDLLLFFLLCDAVVSASSTAIA